MQQVPLGACHRLESRAGFHPLRGLPVLPVRMQICIQTVPPRSLRGGCHSREFLGETEGHAC